MKPKFSYPIQIRFHDVDSVGIVFFGNVYALAHNIYEEFVQHLGLEWQFWFENPDWAVPIRQSACEYLAPLKAPETYQVGVSVEKLGRSSFTLKYSFMDGEKPACQVQLVHVFMDKKTGASIEIPSDIRSRLQTYQS